MTGRAVRKNVLGADVEVSDDHDGLRIADLNHPEAVKRLLKRIHRGDELPPMGCCVEDLEAVRRHLALKSGDEPTLELRLELPADDRPEVRIVPEYRQQQVHEPRHTRPREQHTAQAPTEQHSASAPAEQHTAPTAAEPEQTVAKVLGVLSLILIVAFIWQLGLWGVTAAYTSYAADEAAHTASVGGTTTEVRDDALRSVPSWFRTNIDVSQTDLGTVKATSSMPVLTPIFTVDGLDLTSEAPILSEGS